MIWGSVGFLLGICLGSFVKALADRSLNKRSFWGRSYCENCKKTLQWYDLFPILSYVYLSGRCRYCKKGIKTEYLLAEISSGLIIGFLFWQSFANLRFTIYDLRFTIFLFELIFKTFFITILGILFITDLKKMFIPDRVIIPALKIGFVLSLMITIYKVGYLYYYLTQSEIGRLLLPPHSEYFQRHALMIAQSFFTSILMAILIGGFFMSLIIITRGKGMGGGDVKLGAFIGLMLGFPQALLAIVSSFILGAVFSLVLIIAKRKHFGQSIAFGPFLVLGSLIALFWGNQIFDWYIHLSV